MNKYHLWIFAELESHFKSKMVKRVAVIFVILFISSTTFSQKVISQKEVTEYLKIYGIALNNFLNFEPSHFVLIDNTDNQEIQAFNFLESLDYLTRLEDPNLDSNWLNFIKDADRAKAVLPTIKLKEINSVHTIRLLVRDTFLKFQRESNEVGMGIISPYGWVDGWMTISTPIISKNKDKAIIEISYVRDELDGYGGVLFLEKRKDGEWIVIQHLRTWIS